MTDQAPAEERPSVSLVSLGCSKNQVDSERMLGGFVSRGFRYDPDAGAADLVVINTCGFIGPAREQSVETIMQYVASRSGRPSRKVVVAGCMLERYGDELRREIPEVDYWVDGDLAGALDEIAQAEVGPVRHPMQTLGPRRILLNEPGLAYLRISQGCDRTCSFCAIPGFKGKQASVAPEALVAEARALVDEQGARELVLVAQDLCRYGTDIGYKPGLAGLIEELLARTAVPWIRILYAYPFSLPERVVELMASEPRMLAYLDMPFQHADAAVLKTMRRGHTGERFLDLLAKYRSRVPGLVVRSTMLVGHPGETAEGHARLIEFIERACFEWMGVFEYSDEEGTHAAELGGKVKPATARRRAKEARRAFERARRLDAFGLGREQDAVVVRVEPGLVVARLRSQAPEVDGLTFCEGLAEGEAERVAPGSLVRVVPDEALGMDFAARLVGAATAEVGPRGADRLAV